MTRRAKCIRNALVAMRVVIQLWGRALTFSTSLNLYAFNVHVRETAVTCIRRAYYACAALRENVAGRMGNRISPAESALINFSAGIGSASLYLDTYVYIISWS